MTQPLQGHNPYSYPDSIAELIGHPSGTLSTSYAPGTGAPQLAPEGGIIPTEPQQTQATAAGNTQAPPQAPQTPPQGSISGVQGAPETQTGSLYHIGYDTQPYQDFSGLFSGFGEDLGAASKGLAEQARSFEQQAGAKRDYESAGGKATIDKALQSRAAPDIEAAQKLAFSEYGGPEGFDQATADRLVSQIQKVYQEGTAARRPGGVETMLQERSPGLTTGEAAYEAAHLRGDTAFQAQAAAAEREAQRLQEEFGQSGLEAQAIAKARHDEEQAIQDAAQGQLTGEEAALEQEWAKQIEAELEQRKAAEAAVGKFQQTGSVEDLAALQPYAAEGLTLSDLNTPTRQTLEAGKAKWQAIMDQYPDLAGVPVLSQTNMTNRKREFLDAEGLDPALRARALERQKALVEAGFSPRAENYQTPEITIQSSEPGQYGTLLPMYFRDQTPYGASGVGTYEAPDLRNYVRFDPGVSPSRENVSTEDQRAIWNTIQEILKSNRKIEAPDVELQKAQVTADLQKYIDEETAAIKERRNTLDARQQEWAGMLRTARRELKKQEKAAHRKKVGRIVGGVVGGLVGGPLAGVTGLAGEEIGGQIGAATAG